MEENDLLKKKYESYKPWLRQGRLNDDMLKNWLSDMPGVADVLISEGLLTDEQKRKLVFKSVNEHWANVKNGKYSIDDVRSYSARGEYDRFTESQMITEFYVSRINAGLIAIEQIHLIPDLPDSQKKQLIENIHKNNIQSGKYTDEKIEQLIEEGIIGESFLKENLKPEVYNRFLPNIIQVEYMKWVDLPALIPNRTDVFVLGVPGSGKSTFMSGMLHYGRHNSRLTYQFGENVIGAKYLHLLTDAIYQTGLVSATGTEVVQYMACDFIDDKHDKHPMSFIEMSGEFFQKIYDDDHAKIPEKLEPYITGDNFKILTFVIDFQAEGKGSTTQASKLEHTMLVLEKMGTLIKTDAILIIITKWDLNEGREEPAEYLKRRGYGAFNTMCEHLSKKYGFSYSFQTFSLGKFYGINKQRYRYDPTDSKRIFDWFCLKAAAENTGNKKKIVTVDNNSNNKKEKRAWWLKSNS